MSQVYCIRTRKKGKHLTFKVDKLMEKYYTFYSRHLKGVSNYVLKLQEFCRKPRPCRAGMNARLKLRTKGDIIISNFGIMKVVLE